MKKSPSTVKQAARPQAITANYCAKILRLARKFNLETIHIFQGTEKISKSIIDNCRRACVMMQKTQTSSNYLEKMTGISSDEISDLEPLEYLLQDGKAYGREKISC